MQPTRDKGFYSQNNEDLVILEYFGGRTGNLISVGENDGRTFSNSLALIESGWGGALFEPCHKAFLKLSDLHKGNAKVKCYEYAIGEEMGEATLYENGSHLSAGDWGLLSTLKKGEIQRWKGTEQFTEQKVDVITWNDFYDSSEQKVFEFVSIDAEGLDFEILRQIDLSAMQTELVCIETNFDDIKVESLKKYFNMNYGMKLIHRTHENSIFAK